MSADEINEDTGYEMFAQEIYQTLLNNEDIKPINVQHDVELAGRSGCTHQIDVYWEYEIAGVMHRVAIECKNYNTSNVPIGRIRDFFGALTDIGNINGIFVCKNGYQSGAIKFAEFYGINLKELRVPIDSDWVGRLHTIQMNISALHMNIKQILPVFDTEWFKVNFPSPSIDVQYQMKGLNSEILIKDKAGNKITDLLELENKLPHEWKDELNKEHEYTYDDAYMDIEGLGAVKIVSVKFTYDVQMTKPKEIIISGKDTAKAILKDVNTGVIKFFDKEGNIK